MAHIRAAVLAAVLILAVRAAAQEPRLAGPDVVVVATEHLETKGITTWILESPAVKTRSLLVARLGVGPRIRVADLPMHDVILDAAGRHALLVVGRGGPLTLERLQIDGDGPPQKVVPDLGVARTVLHRCGDDVLALTADGVVAVDSSGAVRVVRRDLGARATGFAVNAATTLTALARAGRIELVGAGGLVVSDVGWGADPAFLDDAHFVYVQHGDDLTHADPGSAVVFVDFSAPEPAPVPILSLNGTIQRLRSSGDGCVLLRHAPLDEAPRDWLLHVATGVIRPMHPRDYGALRPALAATSRPTSAPVIPGQDDALPEPELETSGFFYVGESGVETRTAFEEGGFDEARHGPESIIYRLLLDRFLDGAQWPFRRQGAYDPVIATDDEPFRPHSAIPHRGLDLGARLVHVSTGSIAFHVPGTYVFPLYRGGTLFKDASVVLRDEAGGRGAPPRTRLYPLLQEIELFDSGFVLRLHIAYEHAGRGALGGEATGLPIDGSEPIGDLESFDARSPAGGWATSDPVLRAAGLLKGNHLHVGIGGIYRSFNGSPAAGSMKLRWYRERLIPALKRSRGP
jgi:hypothetical protein